MASNDNFDDLFRSSSSSSARMSMPSPGRNSGAFGYDDATDNPFADLQSSRISSPYAHLEEHHTESNQVEQGISELHIEPDAQDAHEAPHQHYQPESSTTKDESESPKEPSYSPSTPSYSEYNDSGNHADRVLVSPFASTTPFGETPTTGDQDPMNSVYSSNDMDPYADVREQSPFDSKVEDSYVYNGVSSNPSEASTPALHIDNIDEDVNEDGFGSEDRQSREEQTATPTERTDVASIRTVGLESDAASLRSTKTAIQPETNSIHNILPPLLDGPSGHSTFHITVSDPTKVGSSIDPINQHTVYTIRTRTSNSTHFRKHDFSVLRRYRDFRWLYDRLLENNPGVIVPPPPEKAAIGRFSQDFVETRRLALQHCLQQIVKHPKLYTDPDLRTFLESDTFSIDIKQRAQNASQAAAVEPKPGFFSSLTSPRFAEFDDYFDHKRSQLDAFESSLKIVVNSVAHMVKVRLANASSSSELSHNYGALKGCELSDDVKTAIGKLEELESKKAGILDTQAKEEETLLLATAEGYLRLIGAVRLAFQSRIKTFQSYQRAEAAVRNARSQHDKIRKQYAKTNPELVAHALTEISEAERRALSLKRDFEDCSKLIKTEMARFDSEKIVEFRSAMHTYSRGLTERQRDLVESWKRYVSYLENVLGSSQRLSGNGAATSM